MALVKGRSDVDDLDFMAQRIHCALFGLNCSMYFEWVESASNWSDELSRVGLSGEFAHRHGFRCYKTALATWVWSIPLSAAARIFSF